VTGEVMQISSRDSALYAGFGQGQRMVAVDSARFLVGGRVADFRRDGARTLARPDSAGPFTAVQVAAATPTPLQLGAYVGAYTSPELGVTHAIALRADTLRLEVPGEDAQPLLSMDADGFRSLSGGVQLTFTRDRRGQVDGFEVFAGRVLHLRFDRQRGAR
jgi:hypothetical protein